MYIKQSIYISNCVLVNKWNMLACGYFYRKSGHRTLSTPKGPIDVFLSN